MELFTEIRQIPPMTSSSTTTTRVVIILIVVVAALRGLLALAGFFAPQFVMRELGAPPELNPHMPYVVRVWAIRDIVLAGFLMSERHRRAVVALLLVAIIDAVDVISAGLAALEGPYDAPTALGLAGVAIAFLIPELVAIAWIRSAQRDDQRRSDALAPPRPGDENR